MILFPNCKINLGLNILHKRTDGYHALETVFYPLPLRDALEVVTMPRQESSQHLPFTMSGLDIEGHPGSNLCMKAYRLLKNDHPALPKVRMHLHKVIPTGAGLGGGSADAAFTLLLLNKKFDLNISQQKLIEYALLLGSDCPFFILNQPCFAEGRGEQLQPLALDLSGYRAVIINPGIHINTSNAFMRIQPGEPRHPLKETIMYPVSQWKDTLINDFENVIFEQYPLLGQIKTDLYKAGAVYASMSGSGSTLFGLFKDQPVIKISKQPSWFYREMDL
jgi:4-diphosphocytidyl-2-C-methyl-D-erythritol kinase